MDVNIFILVLVVPDFEFYLLEMLKAGIICLAANPGERKMIVKPSLFCGSLPFKLICILFYLAGEIHDFVQGFPPKFQ